MKLMKVLKTLSALAAFLGLPTFAASAPQSARPQTTPAAENVTLPSSELPATIDSEKDGTDFDEQLMRKLDEEFRKLQSDGRDFKNPEEGEYFEGDILLPEGEERNFLPARRWPNGIVYYSIGRGYSADELRVIELAMCEIERKTCLKFEERTSQQQYIKIVKKGGCYSYVGRLGIPQELSLAFACLFKKGTAVHEFVHAIGFGHEHTRADRDRYVQISEQNIKPGFIGNFRKMTGGGVTLPLGHGAYDYGSVTHYTATAFSRNGLKTIKKLRAGPAMGQRKELSKLDAAKINSVYNCGPQSHPSVPKDSRPECPKYALYCYRSTRMQNLCKETCYTCGR